MRHYVEKLEAMSDIELAREWYSVWYEYRRYGRDGSNLPAYNRAVDKKQILQDVIVDRFVKRAYF